MSQHPTNNWQSSAHGGYGGQHYVPQDQQQAYQYGSYHPGHPAPPVFNGPAQSYPYNPQPAQAPQTYYHMSSNQSSQQPSGQDDRAKRVRTTEPGQAQSYPAYATPQPASHQAQAATAAAADAYRQRTQGTAGGQAASRPAHPPTDLPPRPYPGGGNPYAPPKPPGKITGAQMQYLPGLEARLDRLEHAVDQYVDMRAKKALDNSILPGTQGSSTQSRGDQQQQGSSASQSQTQQRK